LAHVFFCNLFFCMKNFNVVLNNVALLKKVCENARFTSKNNKCVEGNVKKTQQDPAPPRKNGRIQ